MEEKKWFPQAKKSVSTSSNKAIFQKLDLPVFTNRTEISKLKNIVSTRQKVGFHQQEWKICLRIRFFQTEKTVSIDRNIQKIKENGWQ